MSPQTRTGGRATSNALLTLLLLALALLVTPVPAFPAVDEPLPPPGWHGIGLGLAGTNGVPNITSTGNLIPGQRIIVEVESARPLAMAHLVLGFGRIDVPFAGGIFHPTPDYLYQNVRTGPAGKARRVFTYPRDLPHGIPIYLQWWIEDPEAKQGFSATQALLLVTP